MNQRYPLPEDVAIVEKQGIAIEIPSVYVAVGEGRTAFLTVRGVALYRYALKRYGIDYDIGAIRVVKDVTALNRRLVDARTYELAALVRDDLTAGRVDPREREFVKQALEGTYESMDAAGKQYEVCKAAGENVYPMPGKRKTALDERG